MNGWYAIRQDYLVDSNSPATSITVFLRLTGLEKATAYDMELGVDSGFKIVGCIQSAAWASKDTFEFTTDADLRTNYELVQNIGTAKLIEINGDNLVYNSDRTFSGYILIKAKTGEVIGCSKTIATDQEIFERILQYKFSALSG